MGEALLEEKMARRSILFAQLMKGESGFLGLLYPPTKKLLNNIFFALALFLLKKKHYISIT
jgi:hypothetical protein